ncbi:ribonuclease H1 [Trypanosoma rangeli]|uniref:ribonuclease H n=1 Tax=Trypanosoma rangeli TaxID=5698 RepID=A0A3R7MD61_TRYRA|nr:ribonuclease H1 [Trypanosoma rangeli]RNF03644.1 ribonuclease H1 [Trypanosoma rangeli]|eukprot:RNF03644.1 ribonuclease H1 [Trypanosoma rangeli]
MVSFLLCAPPLWSVDRRAHSALYPVKLASCGCEEKFAGGVQPTAMSSLSKKKYYAVAAGYKTGIYESWDECSRNVTGFPRARFKSFKTLEEAQAFLACENDADHKGTVEGAAADVACGVAPTLGRQECLSVEPPAAAAAAGRKRQRQSLSSSASLSPLTLSEVEEGITGDAEMLQHVSHEWMKAREQEAVEVYVDGACRANGKGTLSRGGYGGYYGENDPRNFSLPLPAAEPQTNNRAELHAVIHVIRIALEAEPCYNLRVFSDSVYTIRGADFYMHKWIRNGFWGSKGSTVANCDLWKTLHAMRCRHAGRYCDLLVAQFGLLPVVARKVAGRLSLQLVHVKGHSGIHGNEMADHLAVMGALHGRSTDE